MPQEEIQAQPKNIDRMDVDKRREQLSIAVEALKREKPQANIVIFDLPKHADLNNSDQKYVQDLQFEINKFKGKKATFIINIPHHYMTVDIDQTGKKPSCILLDASTDYRAEWFKNILKENLKLDVLKVRGITPENFFEKIKNKINKTPEMTLQHDHYSCSLFALDHCKQLLYVDQNFHASLRKKSEDGYVTWDKLPPNFVWNSQSSQLLSAYEQRNRSILDQKMPNGLSYNEYLKEGRCTYQIWDDKQQKLKTVKRNEAINVHVLNYVEKNIEELKQTQKQVESNQKYKELYTQSTQSCQQEESMQKHETEEQHNESKI